MSKKQIIILLVILNMVVLFLGFPELWDKILLFVSGLLIISLVYKLPQTQTTETTKELPFIDHKNSTNG